jgi:hypothetical protein
LARGNGYEFTITHNGSSYKVEVSTGDDQNFKGKAISVEMGLFKVICQILKAYGGAPVQKNIT